MNHKRFNIFFTPTEKGFAAGLQMRQVNCCPYDMDGAIRFCIEDFRHHPEKLEHYGLLVLEANPVRESQREGWFFPAEKVARRYFDDFPAAPDELAVKRRPGEKPPRRDGSPA